MHLDKKLYFILPSKGYEKTPFQAAIYSLLVLRQAFYLKLNLNQTFKLNLNFTKPFWADVPHRYSFITKFSLSFINVDITSPGILVITSPKLTFD